MSNEITNPYQYFPDFTRGRPVFNGKIYIGAPDTDPTIGGNQLVVLARQEDGTEIGISQPIRTGAGGIPSLNGSPVTLLIAELEFSVRIDNAQDVQQYEQARVVAPDNLLRSDLASTDSGKGFSLVAITKTAAEIAAGVTIVNAHYYPGNVLRYGTNTTPGTTDMTVAIQAALDQAGQTGGSEVYLPSGIYLISSMMVMPTGLTMRGAGKTATEIRVDNSIYPWAQGVLSTIDTAANAGLAAYRWGTGTINKYDILISDIRFNLDRSGLSSGDATASNAFAVRFEDAQNCRITNCHFADNFDDASTDNGYQCINFVRTENCKIDNCDFDGISGILAQDTNYTQVIKNTFRGNIGSCIDLAVGTYHSVLDNDVIDGTVWAVSSIGVNCTNSVVRGNKVAGQNLSGITLGHTTLDNYGLDPLADGTVCEGNAIEGGDGKHGILLQAANRAVVTSNTIKDIGTTGLGAAVDFTAAAISARASSAGVNEDITITNNSCINVNRGINLGNNGRSKVDNNTIELWAVLTGAHDGAGNAAVLTDSAQNWPVNALIGWTLTNVTDGSSTTVTANTATTITGVLAGGTDDDWDANDRYYLRLSGTANFQEGVMVHSSSAPDDNYYTITGNSVLGGEMGILVQNDNATISDNDIEKTSSYPIRVEDHHAVVNGNRLSECDRECSIFRVTACVLTGNIFFHSNPGAVAMAYRITGDGTSADVSWEEAAVSGNVNIGATSDVVFTNVNNAPANPVTLTKGLLAQNARGTYSLEDLPTAAAGLSTGDLWNNGGVVTIA